MKTGRNPRPTSPVSTVATPEGAAPLLGGAALVCSSTPFPLASREKSTIQLGGGGALGVTSFLKAPFSEARWALGFSERCFVCSGGGS